MVEKGVNCSTLFRFFVMTAQSGKLGYFLCAFLLLGMSFLLFLMQDCGMCVVIFLYPQETEQIVVSEAIA